MSRSHSVNELVNAFARTLAGFKNVNDSLVTEKRPTFGVRKFTGIKVNHTVSISGIDVESAGLARLIEHLDHTGQIEARKVAGQCCDRARHHLGRLKTFHPAENEGADVSSNIFGAASAVDVIVAAAAKCFHERLIASVANSNERNIRRFRVGMK